MHHLVSRVLHPELSVASLSQILQILFSLYSCHRSLKIWVTKFRVQESQAFKRPRHVVVYLLLTFQRVAHMGTFSSVASALQIVAQVPATMPTILYAHVAQHGVEVECCHVERLGHLRGSQSVLGLLGSANCCLSPSLSRSSSSHRSTSLARISSSYLVAM